MPVFKGWEARFCNHGKKGTSMFFILESDDQDFNGKMSNWRRDAIIAYLGMVLWVFGTPFMAAELQARVSPEVVDMWLSRNTVGGWVEIYLTAFIFIIIMVEVLSYSLVYSHKLTYPPYVMVTIGDLAKKAGFEKSPRLIYNPEAKALNAAAMRSLFFGRKLMLFGDIKKLSSLELEAVLAHEMAHLIMRDVRFGQLAAGMLLAIRLLSRVIMLALIVSVFIGDAELVWLLLSTFIVTHLGAKIATLFHRYYSRVCEYRADAITIQLTSPRHREYLVSALKKVSELSVLVYIRKRETEEHGLTQTHPSIAKRARSLGLRKLMRLSKQFV